MEFEVAFSAGGTASAPKPPGNANSPLTQAVLDGLSAHIAVVDGDGAIVLVNQTWRDFAAANSGQPERMAEGANYLAVCDAAAGEDATARQFVAALRAVLAGGCNYAEIVYPCHSPQEQRWFIARITRLPGREPIHAIVAHENVTQRVLAQQALLTREQELRRSQEVAHIGHWTWDTRTNVVSWSDEMKRIFGLDPDHFAGNLDTVIERSIHPDDTARVRAVNQQVIREGRPEPTEYRIIRLDGDIRYVRATPAARVLDDQGGVSLLAGVVQDITEQKQVERALLASEARYRALFENSHTVMLLIDPRDGTLIDANQAAADYYGWTCDELRTMRIFQINTLPRHWVEQMMEQALTHARNHFIFQHRRADGSVRDVEVLNGPVHQAGRTMLYSIVHDITERKRAEEALGQSQLSLARAQQIAGLGSWEYDVITRASTWSDELYRLLGADPLERLSLTRFWALLHPDDQEQAQQAHEAVLQSGQALQLELRSHPDYLPQRYFNCHLQAIRDGQGQVRKLVGTLLDISARKQAEQAVQALSAELERVRHTLRDTQEKGILSSLAPPDEPVA